MILPKGSRRYRLVALSSQTRTEETAFVYNWEGKDYIPHSRRGWSVSKLGLDILSKKKRLQQQGSHLCYIRYADERPGLPYTNQWVDTAIIAGNKKYVVETAGKITQRCLLMTTDPGDLVFDPTCDTSRVALTLAKQRLMTANFDYYRLAHPHEGVGSGFVYKTVPHITLKSIANNEPPAEETLYNQPENDRKKTRVTGPFTVEAVPSLRARSLEEIKQENQGTMPDGRHAAFKSANERRSFHRRFEEKTCRQ